jgi:ABC-type transport system involved in Fe-S cluster assembly fused permease/ATPase subunit
MSQLSFDHLLNLSFAWHTRRKTGEILRVLDRGAAINHTFEVRFTQIALAPFIDDRQLLLFNIAPTFIDIFAALVAFCILFDWTLACVIFLVMFAYGKSLPAFYPCFQSSSTSYVYLRDPLVAASVILTQWRTRLRRQMNDRDVVRFYLLLPSRGLIPVHQLTRGIHTDCLLNYETVKYFGGEEYEGDRYKEAIREYQVLEYKVIGTYHGSQRGQRAYVRQPSLLEPLEFGPEFHHCEYLGPR